MKTYQTIPDLEAMRRANELQLQLVTEVVEPKVSPVVVAAALAKLKGGEK